MSNKIQKETPKPKVTEQVSPNIPKQGIPQKTPISSIGKQRIAPPNMSGKNANFTQSNASGQINNIIRTMAADITALRKENAELKAKLADTQKKA